jgi:hypothetical protein
MGLGFAQAPGVCSVLSIPPGDRVVAPAHVDLQAHREKRVHAPINGRRSLLPRSEVGAGTLKFLPQHFLALAKHFDRPVVLLALVDLALQAELLVGDGVALCRKGAWIKAALARVTSSVSKPTRSDDFSPSS